MGDRFVRFFFVVQPKQNNKKKLFLNLIVGFKISTIIAISQLFHFCFAILHHVLNTCSSKINDDVTFWLLFNSSVDRFLFNFVVCCFFILVFSLSLSHLLKIYLFGVVVLLLLYLFHVVYSILFVQLKSQRTTEMFCVY